jgi:ketosteroid isomerase-like protein
MSAKDLEANKALARRFITALNKRDIGEMETLMHRDFTWTTAVVGDDEPNAFKPMQSNTLKGKNLPHAKPRLNRDESLKILRTMFGGEYEGSMQVVSGDKPATPSVKVEDEAHHVQLDILGLTAEEDRVAMEAKSHLAHPTNGRTYRNLYHHLFRFRDGQIVLFKEYQDTLHLYDFVTE